MFVLILLYDKGYVCTNNIPGHMSPCPILVYDKSMFLLIILVQAK